MSDRYGKSYARLGWRNKTEPALNAPNLNKMDYALNEVDNRTIELDSIKLDLTEANNMITGFAVNEKTGIITVTYYNGAVKSIPTNLNQISINWDIDEDSQKMIIYLESGDKKELDLSAFITNYEFVDSDTVCFILNEDGTVTADIKKGSITEDKLQPNFLADIRLEVTKAEHAQKEAETAEVSAQYYSSLAMSYTNGLSGIREGEDTDCAKYYKEKAEEAAVRAEQVSDISFATQKKAGIVKPDGTTITVDEDGTLHGANTVEVDGQTIEKTEDNVLKIADALKKLIDNSVQKVTGKDLSTNDFTDALLKKLNSIEEGAQVNPVPINNQLATVPGSPLDAVQGKELRNLIDNEVSRIEENMADLRDMDEDLEDQIDNLSDGILNKVYPVGSVYISFNNNSPANFIGGTWERITDTFLYAATSKISERGGSATSTLSVNELPKHKHDIPVLTGSAEESGSHSHKYGSSNDLAAPGNTHGTAFQANGYDTGAAGAHTHSVKTNESNTGETGNGRPFSIMPPYINVYMWKRID